MKIHSIVRKDDLNAFVNFEDGKKLVLPKVLIYEKALRKGDDISEDTFSELIFRDALFRAKGKAFRLLGARPHSRSELYLKLLKAKFSPEIIESVLRDLEQLGHIDDLDFARRYLTERCIQKKIGIQKAIAELMKRGVAREFIKTASSEIVNDKSSFENALLVAKKRLLSLEKRITSTVEIKSKLYAFLITRGFQSSIIKQVLSSLFSSQQEDFYGIDND